MRRSWPWRGILFKLIMPSDLKYLLDHRAALESSSPAIIMKVTVIILHAIIAASR